MFGSNTSEKQDKRAHLLDVAQRLFSMHGYEAVSIRQLAKEAKVNIAMISYYFGSKEKLFEAIIENKIPATRGRLEQLAGSELSPWEKIAHIIDIYVDIFINGRDFHRLIMREMSLRQRPEHVQVITNSIARNMEIIRGFILEGQEKGVFKYVDVEMTMASIFGSISMLVNSSSLVCALVHENETEVLYSEAYRNRLKSHLKSMMQSHLMVTR